MAAPETPKRRGTITKSPKETKRNSTFAKGQLTQPATRAKSFQLSWHNLRISLGLPSIVRLALCLPRLEHGIRHGADEGETIGRDDCGPLDHSNASISAEIHAEVMPIGLFPAVTQFLWYFFDRLDRKMFFYHMGSH